MSRLAVRTAAIALLAIAAALPGAVRGQDCGLATPAFCETFEGGPAAAEDRGRGGELSRRRFSATRYAPSLSTGDGVTFWAWEAELGRMPGEAASCRADISGLLLPTRDSLICDPTPTIGTRYLLTAVGSQNYGVNAYRLRQPFDFAGRTGRIAFDVDLANQFLLGYTSVVISEDPAPAPNFDLNGRGPNPRNGLLLVFVSDGVDVYDVRDYAMTTVAGAMTSPIPQQRGRLCHVEIRLSDRSVEVLSSPPSADGIQFAPLESRRTATFDRPLDFTRGHVALLAHNHATWKYAITFGGLPRPMPSWNVSWDNIGFDGPIVQAPREYEIPVAAVPSSRTTVDEYPPGQFTTVVHNGLSLGYVIPDGSDPVGTALTFRGVDLANATRARLVFNGYYQGYDIDGIRLGSGRLRYQVNDHPPHLRAFTPGEVAMADTPGQTGGYNHVIDLPLSELVPGDNTLRFSTLNISSGYPNAVLNLDLLVDFDLGLVFRDSFD